MSELPDPLQGQMIRGYSLERLLGRGTLTAVYHGQTQENWQIPELIITVFLLPDALTEQAHRGFAQRFSQEAGQLIHLRHPHLLPVYGFGEHGPYPYLLTPNAAGDILSMRLREHRRWPPDTILPILTPVAAALDYLHSQGFACQFFSPANILIQPDSTVLLTGIGLTRMLRNDGLVAEIAKGLYPHLKSVAGTYLGAPEYLAPEVIQGKAVDGRADIYSLGILLFEMLSGAAPFTGNNYLDIVQKHVREPLPSLHENCPELPVALEIVTNRALHRHPERRYQKASDLVTAYASALSDYLTIPKHSALLHTVERIRALPAPAPVTLMLPSPQQAQKPVAPSWPYSLLTDIQQTRPLLPVGTLQAAAERLAAPSRQAFAPEPPTLASPEAADPVEITQKLRPPSPPPEDLSDPLPPDSQDLPDTAHIQDEYATMEKATNNGQSLDDTQEDRDRHRAHDTEGTAATTTEAALSKPEKSPITGPITTNGHQLIESTRKAFDDMARELRIVRERLQKNARAVIRSDRR